MRSVPVRKRGPHGTRNVYGNVSDIAEEMGFSSRSHFAHRYEQHFLELPRDTFKRSSAKPRRKL